MEGFDAPGRLLVFTTCDDLLRLTTYDLRTGSVYAFFGLDCESIAPWHGPQEVCVGTFLELVFRVNLKS